MRRLRGFTVLAFTVVAAIVVLCALAALPRRTVFSGGEKYTFYVGNTSKNCRVVSCRPAEAELTRLTLREVCGESATFSSLDINTFLEGVGGEILFKEEMDDSVNYYCAADLPYFVELYGKTVNLHICVREEGVTVGSPIIFGGY